MPRIPAAKHAIYFQDDFRLLRELGLNAFRTGIEWARIEPEEGKVDENALGFYHDYFSRLKEMGVTTLVTLHHFTNPRWIHNHGGWLSEGTVEGFLRYVDLVSQEFDGSIDYYVTINEPVIYAQLAYLAGEGGLPPYHRNRREAQRCLRNLNEAIRRAYDIIHERSRKAKVGVAQATNPNILQSWRSLLRWFFKRMPGSFVIDESVEGWEGKFDYYGINYYCKMIHGKPVAYPEGLRKICKKVFEKYRKPILITENGLPNRDDGQRTAYLISHLKSLGDAINLDRTKVVGYCWWSFLHGYEWGLGYKPFFALIDVDVDGSYGRTPTQTAYEYSRIIKNRGFPLDLYESKYDPLKMSLKFENWL